MQATIRVFVNGREMENPEAPPVQCNGRLYVPARQLLQRLGARVRVETARACVAVDPQTSKTTIVAGRREGRHGPLLAAAERVVEAAGGRMDWDAELGVFIAQRRETWVAKRSLAIDAGHGGRDTGSTTAAGLAEKDLNLAIAHRLQKLVQMAGGRAVLTRSRDHHRVMAERLRRVRSRGVDALISIHHNSHADTSLSGCEAYFFESDAGRRLAFCLQDEVAQELGLPDRGVREAGFDELRHGAIGAVCKLAFLSNPKDAAVVASPYYPLQAALALFRGWRRFCEGL